MDRAIRLAEAEAIANKTKEELVRAFTKAWYGHHGEMKILYTDGEGGLTNDYSKDALRRLGTELRFRAPGQHANYIERRNSILRHTMHLIEEDVKRYDYDLPFDRLLAEAVFVCNAFTFYNGFHRTTRTQDDSPHVSPTWRIWTSQPVGRSQTAKENVVSDR